MAALYSQGLAWEQMHHLVREYARQMSSVQHLLWDLTLPIMSVFNGVGFDRVVRETFKHGAQQIEDLWLRYSLPLLLQELWCSSRIEVAHTCHVCLLPLLACLQPFNLSKTADADCLVDSNVISMQHYMIVTAQACLTQRDIHDPPWYLKSPDCIQTLPASRCKATMPIHATNTHVCDAALTVTMRLQLLLQQQQGDRAVCKNKGQHDTLAIAQAYHNRLC